ncbi:hypothetical protein LTS10_013266 [Elasticomyces elasticus]|nr:hypothetical protein LTS10_013266 [Elasticomyces elasticus]
MEILDDEHPQLNQLPNDHNACTLGSIHGHDVVIAGLPATGNTSTATVVAQMKNNFHQLRFGLLVSIGGGVPTRTDVGLIRLGHVVVSELTGQHSERCSMTTVRRRRARFDGLVSLLLRQRCSLMPPGGWEPFAKDLESTH